MSRALPTSNASPSTRRWEHGWTVFFFRLVLRSQALTARALPPNVNAGAGPCGGDAARGRYAEAALEHQVGWNSEMAHKVQTAKARSGRLVSAAGWSWS